MQSETIHLGQLKVGERARVLSINADDPVNQRLMIMGLLPQMEITLKKVAPLGDPIAIEFEGRIVSLRRAEAKHVQLERLIA